MRSEITHAEGTPVHCDLPKERGGMGVEMSPTDLFAASVGACVLSMMGLKAHSLGIDLRGSIAEVSKQMKMKGQELRLTRLTVHLTLPQVDEKQQPELEAAGHHCPLHLALEPGVEQEVTFSWGALS